MRFSQTAALLFLSAISAVHASSDVHELNADNFDEFFASDNTKPAMVEFYAPWCGHCKALAPKYEEAATALKSQGIRLAKVDCEASANTNLCAQQGIQGYPTLKVVHEGNVKDAKIYGGQRSVEGIVAHMEKQSMDLIQSLTSDNFEKFKEHSVAFVAFYDQSDKSTAENFKETANHFREDPFVFGAVTDAELAKAEGVKFPAVVVYKNFDDVKVVYDGKIKSQDLVPFVKLSSTRILGEIGPETYSTYKNAGIPLAYIFAYTEEERKQLAEELHSVAKEFRGKLNVATIDAKAYGEHAGNLNLEVGKWPAFVIQDFISNKKYTYDQAKEITSKSIGKFVKDYVAGKIEPTIKSEAIPDEETQKASPVTIVVAHNLQERVIDNEKDVLVEYYAPWCGHCKKLAPEYEALAVKYKPFSDKVDIAKIDGTANDVNIEIQGFPTIMLFPAGKKDEPVAYSGNRTPEDFAQFIANHGTHKINAYVEKAPESKAESKSKASETASASSGKAKDTGVRDEL